MATDGIQCVLCDETSETPVDHYEHVEEIPQPEGDYALAMYCQECDEYVEENWDAEAEQWKCPDCGATPLYESKEGYIKVVHTVARFQKEQGAGPRDDDGENPEADA